MVELKEMIKQLEQGKGSDPQTFDRDGATKGGGNR